MSKSLLKSEKLCLLHCPHPQSFSGFIISNWVDLAHCAFGKFSLPFAKVFLSFIFLEIESRRFCSIFFPRFGIKLSCNSPEFPSCFFFSQLPVPIYLGPSFFVDVKATPVLWELPDEFWLPLPWCPASVSELLSDISPYLLHSLFPEGLCST